MATRESCTVGYYFDKEYDCLTESDKVISKCNVSGSWLEYDKQIEQACQTSYLAPIWIFKNMYCAICNPTEYPNDLNIDKYRLFPDPAPLDMVEFRTLFTLVAYNNRNDTHSRKLNDTCQHYQMYDVVQVSIIQLYFIYFQNVFLKHTHLICFLSILF